MRNITDKIKTQRTARAKTSVSMSSETLKRLLANDVPKKDVLAIARAAGVMAAKNTPLMIPYCHTVPIHGVEINYTFLESQVVIESFVQSIWNTGLEMEAMLSASATALTIYDMLKPIDKGMQIEALVLQSSILKPRKEHHEHQSEGR